MRDETTYVYFIRHGRSGSVKIGTSKNPIERLKQLQTGNPKELLLMGVVPESVITESELHDRFADANIRGEWFRMTDDLWSDINLERHGPLKPCPFCGGEGVLKKVEDTRYESNDFMWFAVCLDCMAFGPQEVLPGIAVSKWNNRIDDPEDLGLMPGELDPGPELDSLEDFESPTTIF